MYKYSSDHLIIYNKPIKRDHILLSKKIVNLNKSDFHSILLDRGTSQFSPQLLSFVFSHASYLLKVIGPTSGEGLRRRGLQSKTHLFSQRKRQGKESLVVFTIYGNFLESQPFFTTGNAVHHTAESRISIYIFIYISYNKLNLNFSFLNVP